MTMLKCPDCGQYVRNKPFLGTLHFCLSSDERQARIYSRNAIAQQKAALARLEQDKVITAHAVDK